MSSSTFGRLFSVTTFGESHGEAVGAIVDGAPPGHAISVEAIQYQLDRRRPGQSAVTTQRKESDTIHVLSGLFEGKTTGTPICLIAYNEDARSQDYEKLKQVYRPGHADMTYAAKYGIRDYRGSGRASGRETLGRVAAGAIARQILAPLGPDIVAGTVQVADVRADQRDWAEAEKNSVRCPDKSAAADMEKVILAAREDHDSVGGVVEIVARGVPAGWGDPTMEKLDAEIARAMLSIPAIKGVEIGDGFAGALLRGSQSNDAMGAGPGGFLTNHQGGILGGISTGQDIVVRIAVKPASSIAKAQQTVDVSGQPVEIKIEGRHDPCICPRVVPVAEAMMALVLVNAWLRQRALRGDVY
ncbi:MAG TPA: chorismate synthase [Candidatus Eisenbacteria bacterium]|nr:chorismate synthase [Candidatus Eisenbacteria bacterium]